MSLDVRPGDVWQENDGDHCFIIEATAERDYMGEPAYAVHAYYTATSQTVDGSPDEEFRWATRWASQLDRLVYRQEETDIYTGRNVLPEPRADLRWVAVDLDGTIAEPIWTPENPTREIGEPIWRNINKMWRIKEEGYKVVIHTARGWEHYEAIESWLGYNQLPWDKIVCGKLLALRYIDDRAIHSEEDSWLP